MDLPPLNEGDEAVSLSDLLSARDTSLKEEELWALCRESCLVLQVVNNSQDMFQTLCITPETVAFDQLGNVCFLDLDVDPEPLYIPPEYDHVGNSYKSHLFSLGMTLLFAAEYNGEPAQTCIGDDLQELLGCMTSDDLGLRPDLESVIVHCEEQLGGKLSQDICSRLCVISLFTPAPEGCQGFSDVANGLAEYIESRSTLIKNTNLTPNELEQNDLSNGYLQQSTGMQSCITPQDYHPNSPFLENVFEEFVINDLKSDSKDHYFLACDESENILDTIDSEETEQDMERKDRKPSTKVSATSYLITKTTDEKVSCKQPLLQKPDKNLENVKKDGLSSVSQKNTTKDKDGIQNNVQLSDNSQDENSEHEICTKDAHQGGDNSIQELALSKESTTPNNQADDKLSPKSKISEKKKVLTLGEIMDSANRYLTEEELWAVCYEATCKLKKKRNHLPAYVSCDTIVIHQSGSLSFHAIPGNKPLEVIFMAPELQKGVLTEKTCLYGLGITLRSASGKKYSSIAAMSVGKMLEDLLNDMLHFDPDNRPTLEDTEKICFTHLEQKKAKARHICQVLYGNALDYINTPPSEILSKKKEIMAIQFSDQLPASEDVLKPKAFKPLSGLVIDIDKPLMGANDSAFWPVPHKRTRDKNTGETNLPCVFMSSATHFKPIVLQRSPSPKKLLELSGIRHPKSDKNKPKTSWRDNQINDKDEVARKLKELKQNLLKRRQRASTENIDNVEATSNFSKHSSKKIVESEAKDSQIPNISNTSGPSSALDLLLNELQKQGAVPDTRVLASSIARYLESQLSHGSQSRHSGTSTNRSPTLSSQSSPGNNPSSQYMTRDLPHNLNLNIPAPYHTQLIGQTLTLPDQYGGNVLPGYPLQVQLQQDPRTGLIQLVPVGLIAPLSNQSPSSTRKKSPAVLTRESNNYNVSYSPHSDREWRKTKLKTDNNPKSKSHVRGRTAKGLVQKTANQRARNMGMVPVGQQSSMSSINGLRRSKSDHGIDKLPDDQMFSDSEVRVSLSSNFSGDYDIKHHNDDSILDYHHISSNNGQVNHHRNNSGKDLATVYNRQSFKTCHSHNSSPSLSKDSGVNGGCDYRPPPPGSLVERLLNSENIRHQKRLGRVMYLLQEEFTFEGSSEGSSEDSTIAEYIVSLTNLKLETFANAITEKFSDLFWRPEVLNCLFNTVNSGMPTIWSRSEQSHSDGLDECKEQRLGRHGEDPELSASSLSESANNNLHNKWTTVNTRQFHDKQTRPSSERASSANDYLAETSDSTDSEHYERKRRYRKKHQLDKNKSSSLHNLISKESFPGCLNRVDISSDNSYEKQFSGSRKTTFSNQSSRNASPQTENDGEKEVVHKQLLKDRRLSDQTNDLTGQNDSSKSGKNVSYPYQKPNGKEDTFVQIKGQPSSSSLSKAIGISSSIGDVPDPAYFDGDLSRHFFIDQMKNKMAERTTKNQPMRLEGYRAIQLVGRENSSSSLSSSQSGNLNSSLNLFENKMDCQVSDVVDGEEKTRGHVVYHWAMIQLSMSTEVEKFMEDIDEENSHALKTKLQSVKQQMTMDLKMRQKILRFYNRMMDKVKTGKGEHRITTTTQVSKDIREMTERLRFSALCKTHIQMLQAELQGVDTSYLYSIAICPPGAPVELKPRRDNPLLQFQCVKEPYTGCEVQALNAGMPKGLISYLFASTALSDGYVHQFFYCYRYFAQPVQVLELVINIYKSACRMSQSEANLLRIQCRAMDLLHFWVEGYFSIDFEGNQDLIEMMELFLHNQLLNNSDGKKLLSLMEDCREGRHVELLCPNTPEDVMVIHQEVPKRWKSFKSLVQRKMGNPKDQSCNTLATVCVERRHQNRNTDVYFPKAVRRTDAFTFADYTSQSIAEQLALIEQAIFQLTHPVHYLNSKARGVSVALTMSGTRTPSLLRMNSYNAADEMETDSLFFGCKLDDISVQRLIDHAQEISHWVAAEIVSCSSTKSQLAVLTKFVYTAEICRQIRNFATCLAILDGLENLIIKQLSAWRNLPSKCVSLMEELVSAKMHLRNDATYLTKLKDCHLVPTIPSVLLFLLHVQQLELGTFQLANGMYKWSKIRSITQVIDQIRLFNEHSYSYEADYDLQDTLQQRIREFSAQDIHAIAGQHDTNYQRMSSGGLSGAFRKMKGKFQSK